MFALASAYLPELWLDALAILLALFLVQLTSYLKSPLRRIPTVGYDGPLSYLSAIRWVKHSREMIQEGYEKHYGKIFKIPTLERWTLIVSGSNHIEEMRKAPDDVLGFKEAIQEALQTKYTMGGIEDDPYHISVIRGTMTRGLTTSFPDLRDEVMRAMTDIIPAKGPEWVSVPVMDTIMQVVCRTTNRLFVSLPLCRDPDFLRLHIEYAIHFVIAAKTVAFFPTFLKPLIAQLFTSLETQIQRGIKHLQPVIEHRIQQQRTHGPDWPGKPNDLLSRLIDEVIDDGEPRCSIRELTLRIVGLNFAAIHTATMTVTSALYFLASRPERMAPLREELFEVTEKHGWTKHAMDKLVRMDSFLKETQRVFGVDSLTMTRRALKDFTFSDGTFIPKGTTLAVPSYAMHHDEELYTDAKEFQGLRFESMRDSLNPVQSARLQMAATGPNYLLFGYGKHACPGRFFAVNEMKTILSEIVASYDVKFEKEGIYPAPTWFGSFLVPDSKAEVLFRKRA